MWEIIKKLCRQSDGIYKKGEVILEIYDSFITRSYKDYIDKALVSGRFELLKTIWKDKK